MKHVERTIAVDRPLARVWAYLSDFRSTNDWDPGTVTTELISGDGGTGTVYHNTSKFLGRETEVVYTVRRYEPERLIQLEGVNDTVTTTDTMTFEGDEARTQVVYRAEFEFKGAAKLAEPLLPLPLKKLGDDAAKNLEQALAAL